MLRRSNLMLEDQEDLTGVDEHHWLQRNPVVTEALQVLTTGCPQTIYWGGLARGRVRHFDRERQRPGLPQDVSALVSAIRPDGIDLTLVNLSSHRQRLMTVQAGSFGEHRFGRVTAVGDESEEAVDVNGPLFDVDLQPGSQLDLRVDMTLHANRPSCALPWDGSAIPFR